MKNSIKTYWILMVSAILLLSSGSIYPQQTTGQLFEKALYVEEVKGDLSEAVQLYQQVLDENPDDRKLVAKAMLHMGICYEKLGSEQALQAYRNVISKYSEQEAEVALARERIIRLEAHLAEMNRKAEQHIRKGNELFKIWEYESAIQEYENAIKLSPNSLLAMNAQYCIGQTWYRAGKHEEALATLTNLMEENPHSTIAPVTELMLSQVQYAMENSEHTGTIQPDSDEDIIVEPETGITYRKIKTFTGKNDVIRWTSGTGLSPNGKFLLNNNTIVPLDGSDPFDFIDIQVKNPVWSPDGKHIAYTCGDSSIFIVPVSPETAHAEGIPKELLKREKDLLYGVNWSPDSKKLFFYMMDNQEKEYPRIFSLSISDREIKPLTTANFPQVNPACSPDGNTVVFNGPYKDLWLCPVEGGPARELIDDKHTKPHWTPDGKWVFSDESRKGWGRSLNFVRISDKKEFRLTPPVKTGTFASLSPEGKRILFHRSSHRLMWGMKVASASGGPSYEPVAHLPVYGAQWSANSKMIIVQGEKYNTLEEGDAAMRTVPLAGGESSLLNMDVNLQGKPFAYCVTPDQRRVLFVTKKDEDETDNLYMAPISIEEARVTGTPTRIIENWQRGGAYNTKFSMSHDGTKLAIVDNEDIWIFDMDKIELKKITETPEKKKWVAFSPDDQMISYWAFVEEPDFKVETRIISSEGGNLIKTLGNSMIYPWNWSPDSKSLAKLENDKLIIRNIFSDETCVILDLKTHWLDDIRTSFWSPDGKYLAIIGTVNPGSGEKYHLLKISLDDGEITELATDDLSYKYDISWSPDGKWICYCYMETEKVRPESYLWEADFDEIKQKLLSLE
jgi:Tol biopolymer transport system component/outer membrane protein assembly factor BamD (BamD/ComL family)